jgi:hypothetical protein
MHSFWRTYNDSLFTALSSPFFFPIRASIVYAFVVADFIAVVITLFHTIFDTVYDTFGLSYRITFSIPFITANIIALIPNHNRTDIATNGAAYTGTNFRAISTAFMLTVGAADR